ncbi:ATPase, T2SS/T4P/T4SS family [Senegalia massiliensis]|uniref:CpaF family protein n=1 Tax=Senegalia massiliensis TaxID=1720316 RepID=A0A845R217_9CLOT|nr:ATPase, T2SS/T4P/T4SS family [Senegalia massiliensis]NBI07588.1 CpaF family protein [Senegalia massiliensis]
MFKKSLTEENFAMLNNRVKERITLQHSNREMRKKHTQMLINCSAGDKKAKEYVKQHIWRELTEEGFNDVNFLKELTDKIYSKNWGLGHLDKYDVDDVDEIKVHGTKILIERKGIDEEVPEKFNNYEEVITIMRRCLEFDKKQDLSEGNCKVETKRLDGSRVTAEIPPVAKMPYLNIRKFESFVPTTENMVKNETVTQEMVQVLDTLIKGRANTMIIGEMSSGKTTATKWLLGFMKKDLTVGTLETTFELHLEKLYPNRHWVQFEEQENYPLRELFATMLRKSVDVILVGETRSYEVNELIKAMTRGHSGSIGTAHSIGPLEAIDDMADMVLESGKLVSLQEVKYRIARALDIVIQFRKLPNKRRVCAGIYEIVVDSQNMKYDAVPLFEFEIDEENPESQGQHVMKNTISQKLKDKLNHYGVKRSKINEVFPAKYE